MLLIEKSYGGDSKQGLVSGKGLASIYEESSPFNHKEGDSFRNQS